MGKEKLLFAFNYSVLNPNPIHKHINLRAPSVSRCLVCLHPLHQTHTKTHTQYHIGCIAVDLPANMMMERNTMIPAKARPATRSV